MADFNPIRNIADSNKDAVLAIVSPTSTAASSQTTGGSGVDAGTGKDTGGNDGGGSAGSDKPVVTFEPGSQQNPSKFSNVFVYNKGSVTIPYSVESDTNLTAVTWISRTEEGGEFFDVSEYDFNSPTPGDAGLKAQGSTGVISADYKQAVLAVDSQEFSKFYNHAMRLRVDWTRGNLGGFSSSSLFSVANSSSISEEDVDKTIKAESDFNPIASSSTIGATGTGGTSSPTETNKSVGSGDSKDGGAVSSGSSKSSGGLSTGAKAGIGVGAALGALLVIGLLAFFFLRRRRQKKNAGSGYKEQQSSNTYMVDKETQGRVTESPTSPYSDDNQGQRVPLTDIETAREAPATHAPYEDAPPRSSLGSHGDRGTGTQTPQGVSTNVAHLVEEGMTADEIRRLEEEERQLDDEIERAARR